MLKSLHYKKHYLFGIFFLLSILPFGTRLFEEKTEHNSSHELFDSTLLSINSIELAENYIENRYNLQKHSQFDTVNYVRLSSNFTKNRFFHGLSRYSFSDNWIAYMAGKLIWSHLSAIVNPNDILKHSEGLCSQQSIIFMELLKRKHIDVRAVGLGYIEGPGHFLSEVRYNNSWHVYDISKEPNWQALSNNNNRASMDYYLAHKDSLFLVYKSRIDKATFDKITQQVHYDKPNRFPAKNMLLFHQVSFVLIYFLPLLFLLAFFIAYKND